MLGSGSAAMSGLMLGSGACESTTSIGTCTFGILLQRGRRAAGKEGAESGSVCSRACISGCGCVASSDMGGALPQPRAALRRSRLSRPNGCRKERR
eukprot:847628-Pyramimonas_sp.AAC.1